MDIIDTQKELILTFLDPYLKRVTETRNVRLNNIDITEGNLGRTVTIELFLRNHPYGPE